MRFIGTFLGKMACSLIVLWGLHSAVAAQTEIPASRTSASRIEDIRHELPDSPGSVLSQSQAASQINSSQSTSATSSSAPVQIAMTQQTSDNQAPPAQSQAAPTQSQQQPPSTDAKPQQPVGTAVAAAPVVSGSPAAQPAGVAIAPGKQHRVRTIVIRVGAVVGAAVAIGTVVALSEGTSGKPPGAR